MKKILMPLLLLAFNCGQAQKNVDGLINAEKSFAAYATANGTKDAFLHYLDSAGIVFEKGQAVNGIESWNKKEQRPGILAWHPQFAEISASGDFGYTSGPWTFQPKTINDSVVARGQYNTVWHQTKNGEWKFLADVGTGYPSPNNSQDVEKRIVSDKKYATDLLSMVKAEEAFIKDYSKKGAVAYAAVLSPLQTILNRNGHLPALTTEAQQTIFSEQPKELQFAIKGSGIATSGDLGFVYGISTVNGKSEGYLHIWRRETAGWKMALEVLQY